MRRAAPPISAASVFSSLPARFELPQARLGRRALSVGEFGGALGVVGRRPAVSRSQDRDFGVDQRDAPLAVLDRRRHRRLAHRNPGAGGVDQADRLVRQLPAGM